MVNNLRHYRSGLTGLAISILIPGLLFCAAPSWSAEKEEKEPTVITSQTLTADNKARTALFEGSVTAKKGDMTITSDRMMVHYSGEKGSSITRIDADGHVKLLKGERSVTSKAATYLTDPERVIFTGEPVATDGDNVVKGSKMTYFVREDRYTVESSKVFLKDRK
ncbi:MAG: LptA/OstA family protein [Thermodesulfovibrionales bacterium]|jgi:lipopolysaccharide export system protein LptA